MLKRVAIRHQHAALLRCIMLLVAVATASPGLSAIAATFDTTGTDDSRKRAILDHNALEALASPIALYPDELLAIILPAATFPLQIVQAARFLEARQGNPTLEPDAAWDDTVVALLNYPEALALLDSDLAWTERLGDAVITQETALMRAISQFRERAFAAGNLRSDERQQVSRNAEVIAINAAAPDTVYVPYYNPGAVIVPQSTSVYHYYGNPYPLYYYPYPPQHRYLSFGFWGLTTAYTLGWASNRIGFHRHGHTAHPYYQKRYFRPRYRDRGAHSPHSVFNPRKHHRRNTARDARRGGRIDGHHAHKRRHATRNPHPSDRIRQRQPHRGAADSTGFRASNGLLGNGAPVRPQALKNPRVPLPANRGRGSGASGRDTAVAAKPPAQARPRPPSKSVVPLQVRAQEYLDKRRASPARGAPMASRKATEGRRAQRPQRAQRDGRGAHPRHSDRAGSRGISSRSIATRNRGSIGRGFRGNAAGGGTRAGAFLGNGSRSQR